MKKIIIIVVIVIALVALSVGLYFAFSSKNNTNNSPSANGTTGTLPTVAANTTNTSTLADYTAQASDVYGSLPTGTYLKLGTPKGIVQVNNFYLSNPPVVEGGILVIKQTQNYFISYDPTEGSFWLGITGSPFSTWQQAAEQDFLSTLGISATNACKLSVTSGVVYSPGNALDGESVPLSICGNSAF